MSLPVWGCLCKTAISLLSSLLHNTGCLLNFGHMPLVIVLNRSTVRLGNLGLIGADLVYNKAIYMPALVSVLI